MPHVIIKKVWDYCSYNKSFLLFILALFFASSLIQNYVLFNENYIQVIILQLIFFISLTGYGMLITRSRINHGKGLPKIKIKDIAVLGIKANAVMLIYMSIQTFILEKACSLFGFPPFNLEYMLLSWKETINMFFSHDPANTVLFIIFGSILFYVTAFFMEIALAKLADTGSILKAFNLLSIKRSIDVIGWKKYVKEYTLIVITIVILTELICINLSHTFLDSIIDTILSFFVFATQYLGIGAVYCDIKDLESDSS